MAKKKEPLGKKEVNAKIKTLSEEAKANKQEVRLLKKKKNLSKKEINDAMLKIGVTGTGIDAVADALFKKVKKKKK